MNNKIVIGFTKAELYQLQKVIGWGYNGDDPDGEDYTDLRSAEMKIFEALRIQ